MTHNHKIIKSATDIVLEEIYEFKLFENIYPLPKLLLEPNVKNLKYGIDYSLLMNNENILAELYIKYKENKYKLFIHYKIYITEKLLNDNCVLINNNKVGFYTYIFENKYIFMNFKKIRECNNCQFNSCIYCDKTFANCIII